MSTFPEHGFSDPDGDTPDVCICGAMFTYGFHLQVMKRAHLAAHAGPPIPPAVPELAAAEATPLFGEAADAVTWEGMMVDLITETLDGVPLTCPPIPHVAVPATVFRIRVPENCCVECLDAGYFCTPDDGCVTRCPGGVCGECDEAAAL